MKAIIEADNWETAMKQGQELIRGCLKKHIVPYQWAWMPVKDAEKMGDTSIYDRYPTATRLTYARVKAGLTQKQLAERSGVNIRQIQRVELGESDAGQPHRSEPPRHRRRAGGRPPRLTLMPCTRVKDLTGQTFGELTVLEYTGKSVRGGGAVWLCKCSCGTLCEKTSNYLQSQSKAGRIVSCGHGRIRRKACRETHSPSARESGRAK